MKRTPSDLLARIRRRDVLVQHPYESFESSVEAFVAAAHDPKVTTVKATVYRVGDPSLTFPLVVVFTQYIKQFFEPLSLLAQRYNTTLPAAC